MTDPVGHAVTLRSGRYRATVSARGASLCGLWFDDVPLIAGYDPDAVPPAMAGGLMVPWPNRIAGGAYTWAGVARSLEITDPASGSALHGLIGETSFEIAEVDGTAVELHAGVGPAAGYPWRLDIVCRFALGADGLSQEVVVTNADDSPAPCGIGGHPYLAAGSPGRRAVDGWIVEARAELVLHAPAPSYLPSRLVAVGTHDDPGLDVRHPTVLRDAALNAAYSGWHRDDAGRAVVRVLDDAGVGVEIEFDERIPWVQLYTADHGIGEAFRHALAVEPMTCPPDAFNSRVDLLVVPPAGSVSAGWVIRRVLGPGVHSRDERTDPLPAVPRKRG